MKQFADRKRSDRVFQVGDWVYLSLQPYVQTSLALRSNAKLAFRFFGPFQVLQKVGELSYRLQLPEHSNVHPVFHVSELRQGAPAEEVHKELPPIDDAAPRHQVPEQVLQTRQVPRRRALLEQALIKWSGLQRPSNVAELKTRFPRAPAWGQAVGKGGENVMNPTTSGPEDGLGRRPKRTRKPTTRYPSGTWMHEAAKGRPLAHGSASKNRSRTWLSLPTLCCTPDSHLGSLLPPNFMLLLLY
jgi:hypothetical protein